MKVLSAYWPSYYNHKYTIPALNKTKALRHAYSVVSTLIALNLLRASWSARIWRSCPLSVSSLWASMGALLCDNNAPGETNRKLFVMHMSVHLNWALWVERFYNSLSHHWRTIRLYIVCLALSNYMYTSTQFLHVQRKGTLGAPMPHIIR